MEDRGRAGGDELRDHVDRAALQREDHRLLAGVELERRARQQRLFAPVVGVGHERRADALRVALKLESARADERLLPFAEVGPVGNDDRVVVVRRDQIREVPVRRLERELDRRRVDLLDAVGGQHVGERRQRVGGVLRVRQLLERVHDVVGGHRGAGAELDPRAQLERPHAPVPVVAPAQGEHRLQRQLQVAVKDQELARLVEHHKTARVGDRQRVDRGGRRDRAHVQRAAGGRRRAAGRRSSPPRSPTSSTTTSCRRPPGSCRAASSTSRSCCRAAGTDDGPAAPRPVRRCSGSRAPCARRGSRRAGELGAYP